MPGAVLPAGWVRRRLFGISLEETTYARRGFRGTDAGARRRLEEVGRTFLYGYHAAPEGEELPALLRRLSGVEIELQGFAFEGAAMGLALSDFATLRPGRRLAPFLAGPGGAHVYMAHGAHGVPGGGPADRGPNSGHSGHRRR